MASTADTWWSTVFGAMTSRCAISAFVAPSSSRARTSACRGVSPAIPARVAGLWTPRDVPDAGVPQAPAQPPCGARGAQVVQPGQRVEAGAVVVGLAQASAVS